MAEQEFLNYARDDGGNVSVPRRLRTRRNAPEVELAYITPEEAGILSALKPGTPHRGPMEIPNYDSFDAAGNYTSGAAMSAAETGSRNQRDRAEVRASNIGGPRGLAPGGTSNEAQALRNSYLNARAMGQQRSGGNFFGNIARGVGSIFGGLPGTIASWASRLDPRKLRGMNPATGEPYTQDQYEQNRYNRQIQNRIDRLRKTRDTGKYANDPEGWAASDLSGRLAGFENQLGIKDYSRDTLKARDAYKPEGIESGFISEAEYNAQPKFNFNEGPQIKRVGGLYGDHEMPNDIQNYLENQAAQNWMDSVQSGQGKSPHLSIEQIGEIADDATMGFYQGDQSSLKDYQRGLVKEAAAINPALTKSMPWYNEGVGYNTGNLLERGALATQDPTGEKGYMKTYNTLGGDLTISEALRGMEKGAYDNLPSGIQEKFQEQILDQIKAKGGYGDIFQENWGTGTVDPTFQGGRLDIDESELEVPELNYPKNFRTYESLFAPQSIAKGGRVGYNKGGRVGILAAF